MAKTLSQLGEFGLIDLIKEQTKVSRSVIKGIGDDAAVIPLSSKKYLILTADMLLEGAHFTLRMPAEKIGHKAMAASISDIAAMGGVAKYAVVSLGAPPSASVQFISQIYRGMRKAARTFGIDIVGGDTVRSRKMIINVTLVGEAHKRNVVYRNGACAGDHIFVTGPLGRSLSSGRHLTFVPRVAQAQHLVKHNKPTAMIDISDGLVADLGHILTQSRVGAIIEEDLIPRRRRARLKEALYDGEDFELLFTMSPVKSKALQSRKQKFPFYRIGEIVGKSKGLRLKTRRDRLERLDIKGYTHF